ncbi:hypothetical protein FRC12_005739 [Ceratobasidium sp. 428]|nr:hypothetical protein FRC12_005739 [Ceratobasidium sp. 428]
MSRTSTPRKPKTDKALKFRPTFVSPARAAAPTTTEADVVLHAAFQKPKSDRGSVRSFEIDFVPEISLPNDVARSMSNELDETLGTGSVHNLADSSGFLVSHPSSPAVKPIPIAEVDADAPLNAPSTTSSQSSSPSHHSTTASMPDHSLATESTSLPPSTAETTKTHSRSSSDSVSIAASIPIPVHAITSDSEEEEYPKPEQTEASFTVDHPESHDPPSISFTVTDPAEPEASNSKLDVSQSFHLIPTPGEGESRSRFPSFSFTPGSVYPTVSFAPGSTSSPPPEPVASSSQPASTAANSASTTPYLKPTVSTSSVSLSPQASLSPSRDASASEPLDPRSPLTNQPGMLDQRFEYHSPAGVQTHTDSIPEQQRPISILGALAVPVTESANVPTAAPQIQVDLVGEPERQSEPITETLEASKDLGESTAMTSSCTTAVIVNPSPSDSWNITSLPALPEPEFEPELELQPENQHSDDEIADHSSSHDSSSDSSRDSILDFSQIPNVPTQSPEVRADPEPQLGILEASKDLGESTTMTSSCTTAVLVNPSPSPSDSWNVTSQPVLPDPEPERRLEDERSDDELADHSGSHDSSYDSSHDSSHDFSQIPNVPTQIPETHAEPERQPETLEASKDMGESTARTSSCTTAVLVNPSPSPSPSESWNVTSQPILPDPEPERERELEIKHSDDDLADHSGSHDSSFDSSHDSSHDFKQIPNMPAQSPEIRTEPERQPETLEAPRDLGESSTMASSCTTAVLVNPSPTDSWNVTSQLVLSEPAPKPENKHSDDELADRSSSHDSSHDFSQIPSKSASDSDKRPDWSIEVMPTTPKSEKESEKEIVEEPLPIAEATVVDIVVPAADTSLPREPLPTFSNQSDSGNTSSGTGSESRVSAIASGLLAAGVAASLLGDQSADIVKQPEPKRVVPYPIPSFGPTEVFRAGSPRRDSTPKPRRTRTQEQRMSRDMSAFKPKHLNTPKFSDELTTLRGQISIVLSWMQTGSLPCVNISAGLAHLYGDQYAPGMNFLLSKSRVAKCTDVGDTITRTYTLELTGTTSSVPRALGMLFLAILVITTYAVMWGWL